MGQNHLVLQNVRWPVGTTSPVQKIFYAQGKGTFKDPQKHQTQEWNKS